MTIIKFCPFCGNKGNGPLPNIPLPDIPFYCCYCKTCLNKTCTNCDTSGFSNYCTECGSEMTECNKHSELKEKSAQKIETSNKGSKSTLSNEFTIKISILKGEDKKEIKLNDGGGKRYCTMNKSDSFYKVAKKIQESYDKVISIYTKDTYAYNFLDFKREFINEDFENLEEYLKKKGLKSNQGILFYLQIVEKPRVNLSSNSNNNNNYVNSFSRMNQTSSAQVEIHNTFLLQNKQQIIKPLFPSTSNNKNSILSSDSDSSTPQSLIPLKLPTTTAAIATKAITIVKKPTINYIPKVQDKSTKQVFSSSLSKIMINAPVSESDSYSDSSKSSTASARVNKLTIKRTNREISSMKNAISNEKKFKSLDESRKISIKKEPVEENNESGVTSTTEYINRSNSNYIQKTNYRGNNHGRSGWQSNNNYYRRNENGVDSTTNRNSFNNYNQSSIHF